MGRVRLNEIAGIPLFLLPHAIAQQIKKTGDRIYRISVKRTHLHHYNLSVRTKSLPRELAPGKEVVLRPPGKTNSKREAIAGGEIP